MELVAVKNKYQVVIPRKVRNGMKIKVGDFMEAKLVKGSVVLTPKKIIDYSDFPNADGEYTPGQRRAVNRGIALSEKEYKKGRFFGPFDSYNEFIASLHKESSKIVTKKNKRAAR